MATFLNATLDAISDVETIGYTSTSDSTIILSILTANRDGSLAADITVLQYSSGGSRESYLAFTVPSRLHLDITVQRGCLMVESTQGLTFRSGPTVAAKKSRRLSNFLIYLRWVIQTRSLVILVMRVPV